MGKARDLDPGERKSDVALPDLSKVSSNASDSLFTSTAAAFRFFLPPHISSSLDCCGGGALELAGMAKNLPGRMWSGREISQIIDEHT